MAARPRRGLLLTIDGSTASPRPGTAPASSAPAAPIEAGSSPAPAETARGSTTAARGPSIWLSALPLGDGPAADEPLGHALAALDAQWVFLAAGAVAGHEERLRRFAVVLRGLPAWPASPAGPSADPRSLPFGVAVRSLGDAAQSFLEIANDSPYPIRLACLLDAPESAVVEDLGRGLRLAPAAEAGGRNLVLDLLPFGVSAIRIGAPRGPHRVADRVSLRGRADGDAGAVPRAGGSSWRGSIRGSPTPREPANPGFEPAADPGRGVTVAVAGRPGESGREALPPLPEASDPGVTTAGGIGPRAADRSTVPGGWRMEASNRRGRRGRGRAKPEPGAIAIDGENPHSGRGSLRLSAPAGPASVVSEAFAPNVQSSLTIQAFFRSSPADATVRVWIEGESGGQPYVRRSELGVSTAWEPRAVRASDLPPGGLDSARLRFELMTPGVLWIDDLHVGGDADLEVGAAQRAAHDAGGLAGVSRAALRRFRAAGRLALGPAVGRPDRPGWLARASRGRNRGPIGRRRGFCPTAGPQAAVRLPGCRRRSITTTGQGGFGVFVACSTLCFAREPLEAALRQIAELEFDKFELALVEDGAAHAAVRGGRQPRGGPAAAPPRTQPDPVVAAPRLRAGRLVRSRDPPAIRRTLPAGQVAQRRRADDARRAGGHAGRRRGQAARPARRLRHARGPGPGPAHPLRDPDRRSPGRRRALPGRSRAGPDARPQPLPPGTAAPARLRRRLSPTSRTSTSATPARRPASSRSASARARSNTPGSSTCSSGTATTVR